ncbi:MAG: Ppx/GppA family phosphatase [Rubrivivax sp.]|nr:Ppx/GppA family phosphatase [Rubrivivax sp.]
MAAAPSPDTPILAAIDIGSNSFRLELGQVQRGRYRRIEYHKRMVRLGADLDDASRLRESGIQRGLDCLREFSSSLTGLPAAHVRAVATQTLREAANRDEFLKRAQAVLGQPIEVISGREEARLIYAGVSYLQPSDQPRLVIDIGGRSTELILGRGRLPAAAESFAVGSVSLSMRFFPTGRLTAEAFRAAQVAAGAQFEEALDTFSPEHWREALGSSGTAGAVSDVLKATGITDGRITPQALMQLMDTCIAAGRVDRIVLAGLKEDRRAVLPGGLAILYTLATHFGITDLLPAKGALRQGVIIDLHERLEAATRAVPRDMRDHTVAQLQQRYQVDVQQAQRVQTLALALHDGVALTEDAEARRELGWVCALHETGLFVSHHDHHRHSAYLIGHIDAAGFSQSQQRRLADLALAQRGGLRKIEALLRQPATAWMVLCLRLAVIRCHARGESDGPDWVLTRLGADRALLSWHPARQMPNPRTLYLLHEEAQAWSRSGALTLQLPAAPATA